MRTVAIIQARMGSERLPGKVLEKICGKTVLEHVVTRVKLCRLIDNIVVATTVSPKDDAIVKEAEKCRVQWFRGSEENVLERYYMAARQYEADIIVRVCSDCPLFDPNVLSSMLLRFKTQIEHGFKVDYLSNTITRTFPRGLDAEIITFATLETAYLNAKNYYELEHVTPYIYRNPQKFSLYDYRNDKDFSANRWTLDTREDLRFITEIYNGLFKEGSIFTTEQVLEYLKERPEIVEINAHVQQKDLFPKLRTKIGIGTAQFGMPYGISNEHGQVTKEEVREILEVAALNGISIIDTAALYGESEEVIGEQLSIANDFDIVTKTITFNKSKISTDDVKICEDMFNRSLARLKKPSVYGLLVHNADDILAEGGHLLMEKMFELKQRGLVKKIGTSVYSAEQIDKILDRYPIDLIQVPISVLDQRLLVSGHIDKLKTAGIEIHARSVLLQGLLLLPIEKLPHYFAPIRNHIKNYHNFLNKNGITLIDAALSFVCNIDAISTVICGVLNHHHLEELLHINLSTNLDYNEFGLSDDTMLNPSRWKL